MEVDQVDFRELTETCRPKKKRLAECYTYSIRCASRLRQRQDDWLQAEQEIRQAEEDAINES